MTSKKDKIRGCLVGGAIGDALGYAVEFPREPQIFSRYRKNGIIEYELDNRTGKALISDDTQMTLFTAIGIIAQSENGVLYDIVEIIDRDYLSCFDDPKTFHVSTIRKKLNEFVTIGLLQTEKQGKTLYITHEKTISALIILMYFISFQRLHHAESSGHLFLTDVMPIRRYSLSNTII